MGYAEHNAAVPPYVRNETVLEILLALMKGEGEQEINKGLKIVGLVEAILGLLTTFLFSFYCASEYFGNINTYSNKLPTWLDVLDNLAPTSSFRVTVDNVVRSYDLADDKKLIGPKDVLTQEDYDSLKIFVQPADEMQFILPAALPPIREKVVGDFAGLRQPLDVAIEYGGSQSSTTVELIKPVTTSAPCEDGYVLCGDTCYGVLLNNFGLVLSWGEDGYSKPAIVGQEEGFHVSPHVAVDMDCQTLRATIVVDETERDLTLLHAYSPYLGYTSWGPNQSWLLYMSIAIFALFLLSFLVFVLVAPIIRLVRKKEN